MRKKGKKGKQRKKKSVVFIQSHTCPRGDLFFSSFAHVVLCVAGVLFLFFVFCPLYILLLSCLPHLACHLLSKPEMGKKGKKGASSQQSHEVEEEVEEVEEDEDTSSSSNNPVVVAQGSGGGGEDTLEGILERHRRELKDMRNECQRLKKQVTQGDKKKKKDVQTEIETLESSTEQRHLREIALQ